MGAVDPSGVRLFVPAHRLLRLALDLGLPLTEIAGIDPKQVDLARGYPPVGSVVYLDGFVEPASAGDPTLPLRVTVPTVAGGVLVVPIVANVAAREWIVRIDPVP
jgi:hypothetical protein